MTALVCCCLFVHCEPLWSWLTDPDEREPLELLLLATGAAATSPGGSGSGGGTPGSPQTRFVIVTSLTPGNVGNVYLFEESTSACTLTLRHQLAVGRDPYDLAVDSGGVFVYVANAGDANITRLRIDYVSKQFTAAQTYAQAGPAATIPYGMAIHSSGFLYSADGSATGSVGMFRRNASDGSLTNIGAGFLTAGDATDDYMWFTVLDLTGNYLLGAHFNGFGDAGNDTIRSYSVNQSTGALSFVGSYASQDKPWYLLRHPTLNVVYVTNHGSASVSMYTVATNGSLTALGGGTVATGTSPIGITANASHAFVAPSQMSRIDRYSVDAAGSLTALGSTATTATPYGLRLNATGDCLYVAQPNAGTVAMFSVSSSGVLTAQGSIAAGPAPRFVDIASGSAP